MKKILLLLLVAILLVSIVVIETFLKKKVEIKIAYLGKTLCSSYIKSRTKKISILLNIFNLKKIKKTSLSFSNIYVNNQ